MPIRITVFRQRWWANYIQSLNITVPFPGQPHLFRDAVNENLDHWNASWEEHNMLEFDSEEDYLLFLLRWA
jgi:hypothetical protein